MLWFIAVSKHCEISNNQLIKSIKYRKMIKHIVVWNIKETASADEKFAIANEIQAKLVGLKGKVPQIVDIEVGINIDSEFPANDDIVLVSTFNSVDDLNAYQVHPEHKAVVGYVKENVCSRVAVDYEI